MTRHADAIAVYRQPCALDAHGLTRWSSRIERCHLMRCARRYGALRTRGAL
jgi:hypothetical protein